MRILGIDYGQRKIGVSVGDVESKFAEPLEVLRFVDEEKVLEKIFQVAQIERVTKIVVGISEGKTAEATKEFIVKLKRKLAQADIKVEEWDETLSTKMAQNLSRESGMKRKKRKLMEDAFAATFMLQGYLESDY